MVGIRYTVRRMSAQRADSVGHAKLLVFSEDNISDLIAVVEAMHPEISVPREVVVSVLTKLWKWAEIEYRQHHLQGMADPPGDMAERISVKAGTIISEKARSQVRGDTLWKEFVGNGFRHAKPLQPIARMAPCAKTETRDRANGTSVISVTSNVCKEDTNRLFESRMHTHVMPPLPSFVDAYSSYPDQYE